MIRTAIFDGPGKPFRFECVARPTLAAGEALVRVSLCTVCGSDLHTFSGRRGGPVPCVLGHEPVGVVEEVSGDVRDVGGDPVAVGDRVVWSVAVSCGGCFFCTRGLPQKCGRLRKYGHEGHAPGAGPLGGLSTHCHLLAGTALVKVPPGLPDALAAPAGCATATVAAALRAGHRPGEGPGLVAVLGLGMLGLTACAMASAAGHAVVACDVSDSRLSRAPRFGAAHVAKPTELVGLSRSLTAGRGADQALELSGSSEAAKLSLEALRTGGRAVWAGAVSPVGSVAVEPEAVVRRCLTVTGVHNYTPRDLAAAVDFLATHHGRFPFAGLVSRAYSLGEVDEAFEFAESERPVRVAIRCD